MPLLVMTARHHAVQAVGLFVSDDLNELLQSATSTGTAVELLTKAYLASVDRALLADRGERDAVLVLGGHSFAADASPLNIRTIGAVEALKTAKHLHRDLPWSPGYLVSLEVRNAALHMGLVDQTELRRGVVSMCRLVEGLLLPLSIERIWFWGSDTATVVDHLLDEAKSERARTVAAKLAAARRHLGLLIGDLEPAARRVVLAALSGRPMSLTDHQEPQQCPVCEQQGWLLCGVERGPVVYDSDGEDFWASVSLTGVPFGFECPVCGLELNEDELAECAFPSSIELEPDDDPTEAYEPDPDLWHDR